MAPGALAQQPATRGSAATGALLAAQSRILSQLRGLHTLEVTVEVEVDAAAFGSSAVESGAGGDALGGQRLGLHAPPIRMGARTGALAAAAVRQVLHAAVREAPASAHALYAYVWQSYPARAWERPPLPAIALAREVAAAAGASGAALRRIVVQTAAGDAAEAVRRSAPTAGGGQRTEQGTGGVLYDVQRVGRRGLGVKGRALLPGLVALGAALCLWLWPAQLW